MKRWIPAWEETGVVLSHPAKPVRYWLVHQVTAGNCGWRGEAVGVGLEFTGARITEVGTRQQVWEALRHRAYRFGLPIVCRQQAISKERSA